MIILSQKEKNSPWKQYTSFPILTSKCCCLQQGLKSIWSTKLPPFFQTESLAWSHTRACVLIMFFCSEVTSNDLKLYQYVQYGQLTNVYCRYNLDCVIQFQNCSKKKTKTKNKKKTVETQIHRHCCQVHFFCYQWFKYLEWLFSFIK